MSESEYLSRWDEAFNRGVAVGRKEGAEDEKNAGIWHIPDIRLKHQEAILTLMKPYNWSTRRFCRKYGLKYVRILGVYLSGEAIAAEFGEDPGECPDAVVVDSRNAVEWGLVALWTSAELPEWFSLMEGEDG